MRPLDKSRQRRLTLLAMCAAAFMIQLDVTIVNIALPRIQAGLHISPGGLEWIISAYALSLAALIPVGGALGDRYGRKRVFLAGMAVFALGSAACALSPDAPALIASRAVQGAGGAAMLALTLSIITETFPAETRAGAIGTWAAVGGTGFGIGPVAGGVLLTFFGWASVFWVNLPFAVISIAGAAVAVRESRNPQSRRLDCPGVVLSAAGLVAVTLGLIGSASHPWASWPVAGPLITGAALLAGFIRWEHHTPHAMVPPRLLRARSFATASAVYLASYTAVGGALFYVTLLYQDVIGWSVLHTGLSWLFMNAPFLLMAQLAGRLDRRFPAAVVVPADCLGAVGVSVAISDWRSRAVQFPAAVHARALAQAQNVGGARIEAVTKSLGANYRHAAAESFAHGYHLAVGAGAGCLLVAAAVAAAGFRHRRPAGAAGVRADRADRAAPATQAGR